MSHKFRMVSPTLDRSEKWWELPDDACRLTYDWLLWCRHSSPIGLFPMPPAFVTVGLRCDIDEAERRLTACHDVGLVERGSDDIIRIIGWFKSAGGANAPSTFTMHCKVFKDRREIRDSQMRSNAVFEMLFHNLQASEGWKPNSAQFVQAMEFASKLAMTEVKRQPNLSATAIRTQGFDRPESTQGTNWGTIWNTIRGTIPPPSGDHPPDHRGDIERESEMEIEKESENEIGDSSDIQAEIKALSEKAKNQGAKKND